MSDDTEKTVESSVNWVTHAAILLRGHAITPDQEIRLLKAMNEFGTVVQCAALNRREKEG